MLTWWIVLGVAIVIAFLVAKRQAKRNRELRVQLRDTQLERNRYAEDLLKEANEALDAAQRFGREDALRTVRIVRERFPNDGEHALEIAKFAIFECAGLRNLVAEECNQVVGRLSAELSRNSQEIDEAQSAIGVARAERDATITKIKDEAEAAVDAAKIAAATKIEKATAKITWLVACSKDGNRNMDEESNLAATFAFRATPEP